MASSGVNRDPTAEVIRLLAEYLGAQPSLASFQAITELAQRIEEGWAEPEQEILEPESGATPRGATVSITAPTDGDFMQTPLELVATVIPDEDEGAIQSYYRLGMVDLPLQIDVWAKSRAERDALGGGIRRALRSVATSSVQLAMGEAFGGVTATVRITSTGRQNDQGGTVAGGWWRYVLMLSAEYQEIARFDEVRLRELYLRKFIPYEAEEPESTERIF